MRMPSNLLWPSIVIAAALVVSGCQRPAEESPAETPAAAAPAYVPDATIKDLMLAVVDTTADTGWVSVSTEVSDKGIIDTRPAGDEDWARVRNGAITLAESANLLMMPGRHVARPGEKSETPGVELEPAEMEALIEKDRSAWNTRARALHDAAMLAVHAADAHDADRIFEVGETIEEACENCHRQYWDPNEKIPDAPVF